MKLFKNYDKTLSMTKDDYNEVMNIIKNMQKIKDKNDKKYKIKEQEYLSKIKSFISTIMSSIEADDAINKVDVYIDDILRKSYRAVFNIKATPHADRESALSIIKHINNGIEFELFIIEKKLNGKWELEDITGNTILRNELADIFKVLYNNDDKSIDEQFEDESIDEQFAK